MAVAQVVLNRSAAGSWPADICAVVYQGSERRTGCQFSFACRRRLKNPSEDDPRWIKALSVTDALAAREGLLPEIETATHYHTVDVRPVWRLRLREVARIGRHIFYASDRNGSRRASLSEAAQSSGTR